MKAARAAGILAFGFGQRFFVAFGFGVLWVVISWRAMLWWDLAMLGLWLCDLLMLPAARWLTARRAWGGKLLLARAVRVTVEIELERGQPVQIVALDHVPVALGPGPGVVKVFASVGRPAVIVYEITPRERGDAAMGKLYLRYRSFWGLAERWATVDLSETLTVVPDLREAQEQAVLLARSREVGERARRQRGLGREFESLREYRAGDEYRDVSWTATAKRDQLITRTYEAERSQSIWILLDCGRLLGARVAAPERDFTLQKLDYAVNAALSLAQVAVQSGDKVGVLSYGRLVQSAVACGRGSTHMGTVVEALTHARMELREANHWAAARALLQKQKRRCLVVWITDFAESAATPEMVECAMHLTGRHLVLVAAISQLDLIEASRKVPATTAEMYRHAAAQEIVQRREGLLRKLRMSGVLAMELAPDRLTVSVVNEYLKVKERNRI